MAFFWQNILSCVMGCILEVARGSSSSKHGDDADQDAKASEAEAVAAQNNFKPSSMHHIRWNFVSHPLLQSIFSGIWTVFVGILLFVLSLC